MSVNQVNIMGNIGKIEQRFTGSGTSVVNFSLAITEKEKDQAGNYVDRTDWINCVAFGKRSETIYSYFQKGSEIFIAGKLRVSKYQDKVSGQDRYKTEVIVNDFSFTRGSKTNNSQGDYQVNQTQQPQQQQRPQVTNADFDNWDDDTEFQVKDCVSNGAMFEMTKDAHYNGWKVLDDHIALYGPKSGYEILMFNIRKYSERAHKKGQLQDDLRKIITYAEKAKEIAEKYDIEEIYRG